MMTATALIAEILFIGFIIRCVLIYSYRLLLHPLRSYPGPLLAKFTDWYGAYMAIRRHIHIATYNDHQRWGPVVRQGPDKLVFNTVQAVQDIYSNPRLTKSRAYLVTQASPSVYNLFNVVDKSLHRVRRRIVSEGLNDRAVRHFEPTMNDHIDIFLNNIEDYSKANISVDMSEQCKLLALDISGELGFGRSFDLQTKDTFRWLPQALSMSNWRINVHLQFPGIKHTNWEKLLLPVVLPKVRRFHRMVSGMIQARLAQDKNARPDLFAHISDYKDPETGAGLSQSELWSESTFLIPAGGDTVSSLLAATFFYLSRYSQVYERLASEIRSAFHRTEDIRNGPKLSECKFLRACIEESLRISPPANTTLWRDVPDDADVDPVIVDGHQVPPRTRIGVNVYTIHHNEVYFKSPFKYIPERWISTENGLDNKQNEAMHSAFMAFSKGARNCAGTAMAYAEASLVIAKTIWLFDFKMDANDSKSAESLQPLVFRVRDQIGAVHTGPLLRFQPRSSF